MRIAKISLPSGAINSRSIWRPMMLGSAMGVILLAAISAHADPLTGRLTAAARERTSHQEIYDGSYRKIGYPMGDVPDNRGVCTDVVIRAYRKVGIDLQVLVHEDMSSHFGRYPKSWGLHAADSNIDHRRVPNLQRFLERHGTVLRVTAIAGDYAAGDLVTWMLPGNLPHIGIVSDRFVQGTSRPKVLHNIGGGTVEDDTLFTYPVTGHYRFQE